MTMLYDGLNKISFIGTGSSGGKGAGLLRIEQLLNELYPEMELHGIKICIPEMTIIRSDVFDSFITSNELKPDQFISKSDKQMSLYFQKASFPPIFTGYIRKISNSIKGPLAIRSSSLTEDSLNKPFAGIFATKMIPNNNPNPDVRFRELMDAVKFVYSSTWFKSSLDCFVAAGIDINIEKMAVIIQKVHGDNHGRYFYPAFSGVARSYNYFPFDSISAENGIVELAAGLGKTIVDGGKKWFYCPAAPNSSPPGSLKNLLDSGQIKFWAVDQKPPEKKNPFEETEYLAKLPIKILEDDKILSYLCSTYSASSDRLVIGLEKTGFKLINFAPILKGKVISFNSLIADILNKCRDKSGCDIEMEFAVNIDPISGNKPVFAFLQLRPMKSNEDNIDFNIEIPENKDIIVYSENVLGNGLIDDITDIVYINPSDFEQSKTALMPLELEIINRNIIDSNRKYILAGFGRWGSSDPTLGIPVKWAAISGAAVIIESTIAGMNTDLSQGSHFFHNILNNGVPYFSIDSQNSRNNGFINYNYLSEQEIIFKGSFFTHIRIKKGIRIKVNGKRRLGIISI